jgi:hypothetical protein
MNCHKKIIGIRKFFPPRRKGAKVMEKNNKLAQILSS